MSGLAILIPVALLMGLSGLGFFFWAMRNGQFEDLEGAAHRVLIDDEEPRLGDEGEGVVEFKHTRQQGADHDNS